MSARAWFTSPAGALRVAIGALFVVACGPAARTPQQTPLVGTLVQDCGGAPLENVELIAAQLPVDYEKPLMTDLPGRELGRVRTGPDGRFSLPFDSSKVAVSQSVSAVRPDGGVVALVSGPLGTAPQFDPPWDHHDLGRLLLDGQSVALRLDLRHDTGFPAGSKLNLGFLGPEEMVVEEVAGPDAGVVLERTVRVALKVRAAQASGVPDDAFQVVVRGTLVDATNKVLRTVSQTARFAECQTTAETVVLQY